MNIQQPELVARNAGGDIRTTSRHNIKATAGRSPRALAKTKGNTWDNAKEHPTPHTGQTEQNFSEITHHAPYAVELVQTQQTT